MTMEWGGEHTAQKNTLVTGPYILLARSFVIILGCIGVAWGIVEIPVFWQNSSIERIATQIIAGNTFKVETLAQQLPITEGIKKAALCRPAALRSAAIIELRMMEIAALANNRQNLVDQHKSLVDVIRSSLSCAPADPFLWLALYSVEMSENRFRPDLLKYLRLSYRLGPHEGWIALKRNPLAFAAFQQLSPDLREAAVNEFAAMLVDSQFSDQAAEILIGPAWPERELILSNLTRLSETDRRRFADALYTRGYANLPGVGLAPLDSHRFAPQIRVPQ